MHRGFDASADVSIVRPILKNSKIRGRGSPNNAFIGGTTERWLFARVATWWLRDAGAVAGVPSPRCRRWLVRRGLRACVPRWNNGCCCAVKICWGIHGTDAYRRIFVRDWPARQLRCPTFSSFPHRDEVTTGSRKDRRWMTGRDHLFTRFWPVAYGTALHAKAWTGGPYTVQRAWQGLASLRSSAGAGRAR